jgi:acyl carrier protein
VRLPLLSAQRESEGNALDKLLEILRRLKPGVDFESEKSLVDDNVLNSFDVISLVSEINEVFDVHIGAERLLPENFNSVEAMLRLIEDIEE